MSAAPDAPAWKELPRPDAHRPRGTPRRSRRFRWRVAAWIAVHLLVLAHVAHWKLAGTTLSPMEPSEAGETLELGYVNAGFVLFVLLVLATLVLGRFFCGWACHVVAYQDACAWLLGRLGLRPRPVRSRLLAFVPALAAVQMFVLPSAARLLEGHGLPDLALRLTTDDLWARFPGPGIAALTFVVDGALLVWFLGAKGFCTYGCPYGAVFGVADRAAPARIRATDACEGCGHCTATCTSNVRVHEEVARYRAVVDPGCMKCMDCVDVCPKGALYFGFRAQSPRAARGRSRRAFDFTWPEELFLAAVFALALYAWRGLYDTVPFLLALGLAVLTAVGALVLWRAARGAERVQSVVLRRDGRTTVGGALFLAGALGLVAATAHGAVVQRLDGSAERLLTEASAAGAGEREALLDRALAELEWIRRFGLVETADLHNKLGSIHHARGEGDAAERHMRRAVELDPGYVAPRVVLADLCARSGRWDEALDQLEAVLERAPGHPEALRRLHALLRREPENARARALVEQGQRVERP